MVEVAWLSHPSHFGLSQQATTAQLTSSHLCLPIFISSVRIRSRPSDLPGHQTKPPTKISKTGQESHLRACAPTPRLASRLRLVHLVKRPKNTPVLTQQRLTRRMHLNILKQQMLIVQDKTTISSFTEFLRRQLYVVVSFSFWAGLDSPRRRT